MSVADHANFFGRLKASNWQFDTFYDVGANIGRWSQEAQIVFPEARFEMFEPLAGRYEPLDAAAQHSSVRNSRLHAVALSDQTGSSKIKILGGNGVGSSLLVLKPDYKKDFPIIDVECARLDDIVAKRGLPSPDFIKLDTQAGELKVLRGATETLKSNKFILLETWMRRVYGPENPLFHEVASFLYSQNYVLFDMLSLDEGRDPDGTLRWFDAVFINRSVSRFPSGML